MDLESGRKDFIIYIKKYRFVFLTVLIGILFMLLPDFKGEAQETVSSVDLSPPELETELSEILSKIQGVGKTEVLLTEASGTEKIYQIDTSQNKGNMDTVIIKNENREEVGLVKQVLPPSYKGAIIVCQGADSATVRLNVVDAVKSVTGLPSDCITVLKMK